MLVVFSVTAFWQSYAISGFSGLSTAGVFPMLASATMLVSAVCILVQSFRHTPDISQDHNQDDHQDATTTQELIHSVLPRRLVIMMLIITGYLIAMPAFGFILASAAFLFISFSYLWRQSLLVSMLVTVVSVSSVYFIFRKLFQVVLPEGSLLQGLF